MYLHVPVRRICIIVSAVVENALLWSLDSGGATILSGIGPDERGVEVPAARIELLGQLREVRHLLAALRARSRQIQVSSRRNSLGWRALRLTALPAVLAHSARVFAFAVRNAARRDVRCLAPAFAKTDDHSI